MKQFLWEHMRGLRRWVVLAVGLTFVAVACDILVAFPLKFILDKIVNHKDPSVPLVGGWLSWFDRWGSSSSLEPGEAHTQVAVILFSGAVALFLGVVGAVVAFVQLAVAAHVSQDLGSRLRNEVFVHVEHLPLEWHGRQRVGDIVQRATGNVGDIEKLVSEGLVDLLSGVLTLTGILCVMFIINWQFTVLSMIIVPPLFLVVVTYTRLIKRSSKAASRAGGQVAEVANENIAAITELKAFTLERWAATTVAERVENQRAWQARAGRRQAEFNPLVIILITITYVVIISVGAWVAAGHGDRVRIGFLAIPTGSLTIGTLTVFLAYSKLLYQPMRNLSKLTLLSSTASSAIERIQEVFDEKWEDGLVPAAEDQAGEIAGVRGSISYRRVVFGYDDVNPVLKGIDLDVPVGSRIALVGLSGSGKTTLVRLLPRFYEVWDGSITIDGVDIRDIPRRVLRRNIGIVLQDSVLFEGTIRENIVLDRVDVSEEQMVQAARQACIHETIVSLPGGYDAHVREHGKNLSSGQRQRIAIARAILRDAPILILDEPTANLDVEAEAEVMRAIERLTENRTVIVISHRLSTLGRVDQIAVLDDGRIVERGTYQELKAKGGFFARLLAEQNRYAAEPVGLEMVSNGATNGAQEWKRPSGGPEARDSNGARAELHVASEPGDG